MILMYDSLHVLFAEGTEIHELEIFFTVMMIYFENFYFVIQGR